MSVPYTPMMASRILRTMPDHRLASITPIDFQRWPAPGRLPTAIGRELIDAERAMRRQSTQSSSR